MGTGSLNQPNVGVGEEYQFSGREIGIDHPISRADYLSGKCFGRRSSSLINSCPSSANGSMLSKHIKSLKTSIPYRPPTLKKAAIELEPVGVISKSSANPTQNREFQSSWTANW